MKTTLAYDNLMPRSSFYILSVLLILSGCNGFFGEETSTEFLDVPTGNNREVAYVPIQPVIGGLVEPTDIIAGWDELIYVADAGTEEIISYDQAGNELSRFGVPGLTAITQDRKLDILALGRIDTTINNAPLNLPTIYRIDLNKTGEYGLAQARITQKVIHPFYFKSGTPTSRDERVTFTGISILADNQYYVARNGDFNSPNQFGGPDDAILRFRADDSFISPISIQSSGGSISNAFFRKPQGISTKIMPPQIPQIAPQEDFLATSIDENNLLKVQVIRRGVEGINFIVDGLAEPDTSRAEGFLYEPGRFSRPVDVTVAGDGLGYILVVDAETDSLYHFSGRGFEGVPPPSGSVTNKSIVVSFGGAGEGLTQFRNPGGVAYLDRILYVADTGNGRILRFRLTTDFD